MATKTKNTKFSICFVLCIILPACESFLDFEELKSIHYGIDILDKPVLQGQDAPIGSVKLTSKYGQNYECRIPDQVEQERQQEEKERVAMETGVLDLLKPMESSPCLIKTKDWWSYEFCYGKHLRQYHLEDGRISGNVMYIGYYESDFDWNNDTLRNQKMKSRNEFNRYHSQKYTNGSKCDLTGGFRSAEVRFMCEDTVSDYIYRIDEPQTCTYIITVHTNKICHHPYLKPPAPKTPVPITCYPLLDQQQYDDYLIQIAAEEKAKEEEETRLRLAAIEAQQKANKKGVSDDNVVNMEEDTTTVDNPELDKALHKVFTEQIDKVASQTGTEASDVKMSVKYVDNMADLESVLREQITEAQKQKLIKMGKDEVKSEKEEQLQTKNTEKDKIETPKDVDEEIMKEFDSEISEVKKSLEEQRNKFADMKDKIGDSVRSQFDDIVHEAEQEAGVEVDRKEAFQQLSKTLNSLLDKLEKTEEEINNVDKELVDYNEKYTGEKLQQPAQGSEDDKIKVKVKELGEKENIKIDSNTMSTIENKIKDNLEKAGLNTRETEEENKFPDKIHTSRDTKKGGKVQVKIVTAGYYNSDDDSLHLMSDDEGNSFQSVIISLMNGSDDAVKEEAKHKSLEDNYNKVWGQTKKSKVKPQN